MSIYTEMEERMSDFEDTMSESLTKLTNLHNELSIALSKLDELSVNIEDVFLRELLESSMKIIDRVQGELC